MVGIEEEMEIERGRRAERESVSAREREGESESGGWMKNPSSRDGILKARGRDDRTVEKGGSWV